MSLGKGYGIGSKISVVDLSTLLVAAGRENRGVILQCVECSGYYSAEHLTPRLFDMLSVIMAFERIMIVLNPHLLIFPVIRLFT